jgi:hypothetical protein
MAIAHVNQCLEAGKILVGAGKRHETRQQAEEILAQIQANFLPDSMYPNVIFVSRSQLTRKFCHDTLRRGALKVDTLFLEILPFLIERGDAQLAHKNGRLEVFAFRSGYDDPDSPPQSRESGSDSTPPTPKSGPISAFDTPISANFRNEKNEVSRGEIEAISANSANSAYSFNTKETELRETEFGGIGQNDCTPVPERGYTTVLYDRSTRIRVRTNNLPETPASDAGGQSEGVPLDMSAQCSETSSGVEKFDSEKVCSGVPNSTHIRDYAEIAEIAEIAPDSPRELPNFQLRKLRVKMRKLLSGQTFGSAKHSLMLRIIRVRSRYLKRSFRLRQLRWLWTLRPTAKIRVPGFIRTLVTSGF